MSFTCVKDGCERGPATGEALHRINPKGEPFKGACTEHAVEFGALADPVAVVIEQHNRSER